MQLRLHLSVAVLGRTTRRIWTLSTDSQTGLYRPAVYEALSSVQSKKTALSLHVLRTVETVEEEGKKKEERRRESEWVGDNAVFEKLLHSKVTVWICWCDVTCHSGGKWGVVWGVDLHHGPNPLFSLLFSSLSLSFIQTQAWMYTQTHKHTQTFTHTHTHTHTLSNT